MMKKIAQKQLIAMLVILTSFGVLVAHAQENQIAIDEAYLGKLQEKTVQTELVEPQVLPICDHNGDEVRNLSDVAMFASCKDTFDANNDGVHDLSDLSLYSSMNQDNDFCQNTFKCTPDPIRPSAPVEQVPALAICDHNNDGARNLSDVSMFATCKDTFDANNDGVHDLSDIAVYSSMNQDNDFCQNTFDCVASPRALPFASVEPQVLPICDHNNDGARNLSDVSMFATCKDTFDANNDGVHDLSDISLYSSMNQNNNFCQNTFKCVASTSNNGIKQDDFASLINGSQDNGNQPEVLGVKESLCNVDQDVIGQTQWADGSLIRGCDMKIYRIENQEKHYVKNLKELLKYIGQRIYNVADSVVALF